MADPEFLERAERWAKFFSEHEGAEMSELFSMLVGAYSRAYTAVDETTLCAALRGSIVDNAAFISEEMDDLLRPDAVVEFDDLVRAAPLVR